MQSVHKSINTKSRKISSVPQCSSYCTNDVSLHAFPSDPKLCKIWKSVVKITKPVTKYMLVCCLHFTETDFSLNIPKTTHSIKMVAIDRSQRHWLQKCTSNEPELNVESKKQHLEESDDTIIKLQEELSKPSTSRSAHAAPEFPLPNVFYEDKAIETQISDFFELPQILKSYEKLMYFTGKTKSN